MEDIITRGPRFARRVLSLGACLPPSRGGAGRACALSPQRRLRGAGGQRGGFSFRAESRAAAAFAATMSRNYNDELQFLDKINKNCWRIKKGFVPNMQVRGRGRGLRGCGPRFRREPASSGRADPRGVRVSLPSSHRRSPRDSAAHACLPHAPSSEILRSSPRWHC